MMKRYSRTLGLFWSTALAAEMEYRLNFIVATLTSIGGLVGSIFALSLFYQGGNDLAGWTWHQALLVTALFTMMHGATRTFLTPNLGRLVLHVQNGTLDFLLLKPIDTQFWLSSRNVSPWGLPDLMLGFALLAYAGHHGGFGPMNYLFGLLPLAFAAVLLYSMWFILATTSIWFVKVSNVTHVLQSFLEAGRFPIGAYPTVWRFFFTFICPVAFITTAPVEAMLGRASAYWLIWAAALAVTLFTISRLFWRFALRFYTSASS